MPAGVTVKGAVFGTVAYTADNVTAVEDATPDVATV